MSLDFTVVVMMRETRDVAEHFIAYYQRLGAAQIRIFYDGDAAALRGLADDRVEITQCDPAFWDSIGTSAKAGFKTRVCAVANHGFRTLTTDWMLSVDADEYVFGGQPIPSILKSLPPTVEVLRLPTAEAVWHATDASDAAFSSTAFRTALPPGLGLLRHLLYPRRGRFFTRHGLLGHAEGKQFIRKWANIDRLTCHRAYRGDTPVGQWAHEIDPTLRDLYVGHFDAIGLSRWTQKWRSRSRSGGAHDRLSYPRNRQMQAIAAATRSGATSPRQIFRQLYRLSAWQYTLLSLLGCAFQRPIFAHMSVDKDIQMSEDREWWYHLPGSNGGPPDPQSGALTN